MLFLKLNRVCKKEWLSSLLLKETTKIQFNNMKWHFDAI